MPQSDRPRRAGRLDTDIERMAPLSEGEVAIAEGVVRCQTSPLFRRLSYLRVSTNRICLIEHFALRPDRLVTVPRAAVMAVSRVDGSWVRLEIRDEGGDSVIKLRPWEPVVRRLVVEPTLKLTPDELCDLLA